MKAIGCFVFSESNISALFGALRYKKCYEWQ